MPITEAQARRALRHADIPWDREVDDPRESACVVHGHQGVLGGLAAAFAVGRYNLRHAEGFLAKRTDQPLRVRIPPARANAPP
jgi:hypothetical protein